LFADLACLVGQFPWITLVGDVEVCLLHAVIMHNGCDRVRLPSSGGR
jgi:hypothetical protein